MFIKLINHCGLFYKFLKFITLSEYQHVDNSVSNFVEKRG